jgi:hypothetical protein
MNPPRPYGLIRFLSAGGATLDLPLHARDGAFQVLPAYPEGGAPRWTRCEIFGPVAPGRVFLEAGGETVTLELHEGVRAEEVRAWSIPFYVGDARRLGWSASFAPEVPVLLGISPGVPLPPCPSCGAVGVLQSEWAPYDRYCPPCGRGYGARPAVISYEKERTGKQGPPIQLEPVSVPPGVLQKLNALLPPALPASSVYAGGGNGRLAESRAQLYDPRLTQLADANGSLADENRSLLVENARLRRELESVKRKAGKR